MSWSVLYLTESRPLLLSHPAWPSSIPKMEALLCCAAPRVRETKRVEFVSARLQLCEEDCCVEANLGHRE